MKTLMFILTVFLLIIINGCNEDILPVPPDVIAPVVVSGDINVFPTSIKAGETVTVSWDKLVNVTKVTINNTPVLIAEGSKTYTLTSTTTFNINLIGTNDKVIEKSAVVNVVIDPDKARTDSLCLNKYWKIINTKYLFEGKWYESNLSSEQLSLKSFYYPNGTMETFRPSDGKLVGNGKWAWAGKNSMKNPVSGETWEYKFVGTTIISTERNGTIITTAQSYSL